MMDTFCFGDVPVVGSADDAGRGVPTVLSDGAAFPDPVRSGDRRCEEARFKSSRKLCYHMPCKIDCNECDLEKRFEDCVTAHKRAKEHEARRGDHFVTLYDPPPG